MINKTVFLFNSLIFFSIGGLAQKTQSPISFSSCAMIWGYGDLDVTDKNTSVPELGPHG
jgi:hypothetical protein